MNFHKYDYKAPITTDDNYFKPKDGTNLIRILSSPITGWQDWIDSRPIRAEGNDKPTNMGPDAKFFWAMIIWDYEEKKIKIWNCDKRSIQKSIDALIENPTWGSPFYYDLMITRTGTDNKTRYTVMPNPHRQVGKEVEQAFWSKPCFLPKLYTGEHPFEKHSGKPTPGVFEEMPVSVLPAPVTQPLATNSQLMELHDLLADCEPGYEDYLMITLRKAPYNAVRFEEVTSDVMNKVIFKTKEARDVYQSDSKKRQQAVPF